MKWKDLDNRQKAVLALLICEIDEVIRNTELNYEERIMRIKALYMIGVWEII